MTEFWQDVVRQSKPKLAYALYIECALLGLKPKIFDFRPSESASFSMLRITLWRTARATRHVTAIHCLSPATWICIILTCRDEIGDAKNKSPDYSAALCVLKTDTEHTGHGLAFTIGRGNEVVAAAIKSLAPMVVGKDISEFTANMGAFQ